MREKRGDPFRVARLAPLFRMILRFMCRMGMSKQPRRSIREHTEDAGDKRDRA